MLLVKKCKVSLYLFLVKIRLEKLFENFWDRKDTFFSLKKFNIWISKNRIFPKGLTHAFGQKKEFPFLFVLGPNKTGNRLQ